MLVRGLESCPGFRVLRCLPAQIADRRLGDYGDQGDNYSDTGGHTCVGSIVLLFYLMKQDLPYLAWPALTSVVTPLL